MASARGRWEIAKGLGGEASRSCWRAGGQEGVADFCRPSGGWEGSRERVGDWVTELLGGLIEGGRELELFGELLGELLEIRRAEKQLILLLEGERGGRWVASGSGKGGIGRGLGV